MNSCTCIIFVPCFFLGSIANIGSEYSCHDGSDPVILGVIGAPSSVTSIQVANLLKLFKIPQVKERERERERERESILYVDILNCFKIIILDLIMR